MDQATPVTTRPDRSPLATISTSIVRIHREFYGRGPTKAKTMMQGDYVLCVLEDIYTTVEQTLINDDHFDKVREARFVLQKNTEELMRRVVEEATGRQVRGFFSQVTAAPPMAAEVFVLEPAAESLTGEDAISADGH